MPENTYSTHIPAPRAILFSAPSSDIADHDVQASLNELGSLLAGLGSEACARLIQRLHKAPGPLVLGAGKIDELKSLLEAEQEKGADKIVLVYDGELTPGQQRHLARAFATEVLDRTQVILRIFSARARTPTALLEIEAASLKYEASRIIDDDALVDKQAGGGGRGGKGNTSTELRKQELRKRLAEIRVELERAERGQMARRQRRAEVRKVALVGYTNAGKSSWMRVLTGSSVMVQDALFATLETTVRKLHPETKPSIVATDTVGFLRNLPNHLLASFRSTLAEALDAHLLLIVIDGSDPQWRTHLGTTRDVLEKAGGGDRPVIYLVNKLDQMSDEACAALRAELADALFVSSRANEDIAQVHATIVAFFDQQLSEAELRVPYTQAALRAEILAQANVIAEDFDEEGGLMRLRAEASAVARWRERLDS